MISEQCQSFCREQQTVTRELVRSIAFNAGECIYTTSPPIVIHEPLEAGTIVTFYVEVRELKTVSVINPTYGMLMLRTPHLIADN